MKNWISIILLTTVISLGWAQDNKTVQVNDQLISVASRGHDVRNVLHDIFAQSKKSYVLEPNVRFNLYLNLSEVSFEESIELVCKLASLEYDIQNGIYYINKKAPVTPKQNATTEQKSNQAPAKTQSAKSEPPKGTLNQSILNKIVTTRLAKTDIKTVFGALAQQSGVAIEIAADVPSYKLDAFLISTSLKYALDTITGATKLTYRFTNQMSIRIEKAVIETNRVTIVTDHKN